MSERDSIYQGAEDVHQATLEHVRRVLEYAAGQRGSQPEAINELIKTLNRVYPVGQAETTHRSYLPWIGNETQG